MAKTLLHTKALVVKEAIGEDGVVDAVIGSTAVVDRYGDTIQQDGWDLKNYKVNPVILWGHNVREERPPIGKAMKVWIDGKGTKAAKLMFQVKFDLQDSFAAEIFRKVKDGFINTVSVGFLPSEWEDINPDDWFSPRNYLKQELLELSFVPVPANPEALVGLRSFAKSDKRFEPIESLEKALPVVKDDRDVKKAEEENKEENNDKKEEVKTTPEQEENKSEVVVKDITDETQLQDVTVKDLRAIVDDVWANGYMPMMAGDKAAGDDGEKLPADDVVMSDLNVGEYKMLLDDCFDEWRDTNEDKKTEIPSLKEIRTMLNTIQKSGRVLSAKNENKVRDAVNLLQDVLSALDKEDVVENDQPASPTQEVGVDASKVSTKAIAYKSLGTLPESEIWDMPGEVARATEADLLEMAAWYNDEKKEDKESYKLIHHKAEGHKAVWRGVAVAMATLMGARDGIGTDVPEADRKAIYDHLAEHYKEFGKTVPEYKMVEDQALATFGEELHALELEREEKHVVRLIKKVLKKQEEAKDTKPATDLNLGADFNKATPEQQAMALDVINKALSLVVNGSKGGGATT